MKFVGVTLVRRIVSVSRVRFYDTRSACRTVAPHPEATLLPPPSRCPLRCPAHSWEMRDAGFANIQVEQVVASDGCVPTLPPCAHVVTQSVVRERERGLNHLCQVHP